MFRNNPIIGDRHETRASLKNTSRYPTSEVRALLAIASDGLDLRNVAVNVKNSKFAYAGLSYEKVPRMANVAPSAKHLVTLRIGPPGKFPADNVRTPAPEGSVEYKEYWRTHRATLKHVNGVESCTYQRLVVERHPYGGKGSPLIEMCDWREGLVALAAHEFNHIRQFQNNWPRSEVDCEKFAAKRLAVYRECQP